MKTEITITLETDKPPSVSVRVDGHQVCRYDECASIEHAITLALLATGRKAR